MASKRAFRNTSTLLAAAATTAALYFVDTSVTERSQLELADRYMKQVSSQVELFVLKAREEKRRDPIGQAVAFFSQGVEPRVLKIEKITLAEAPADAPQANADGTFELTRLIHPDDGAGIKILLALNERRFLGAHSRFASDFSVAVVFAFFFALIWLSRFDRTAPNTAAQSELKLRLKNWIGSFRAALTEMGIPIRDSLKNTQTILAGVKQSTWLAHKLKRGIHDQLASIHRSRKDVAQTGRIADEILALTTELADTVDPRSEIGTRIKQLLHLTHNLRALEQKNQVLIRRLEIQLEPWATDSDLLVRQLGQLTTSTDALRHQVRDATSKLLSQAQVFRDVKAEATK